VLKGRIGEGLCVLAGVLALHGQAWEAFAGSIRLRTAAALAEGSGPVTLAGVAELEGEDAVALGGVVVLEDAAAAGRGLGYTEVDLGMVRRALEVSGASLGRIALGGSTCLVRFGIPAGTEKEREPRLRGRSDSASVPTIRGRVAGALAELFGVARGDIRLLFEDRDEEMLAQSEWGRRVVVQPTTTAGSSRVMVEVRVYAGDRMIENRRLRVDVEVRRRAVTLSRTVERKEALEAGALVESEMWMAAGVGGGAVIGEIEKAVGLVARSRLEAGSVVREGDVGASIAVRRNEQVTVHCLRSGFEVRARARAKSDGSIGQHIEFSLEGSSKSFVGRVEGPGVAVVDLDAHAVVAGAGAKKEEGR